MVRIEREREAIEVFRRAGGVLRTAEALRRGIHRRELYGLRDSGVLERLSRGVYRLADLPPLGEPDLATVATRVPKAVVAVSSALHFHGLTLEIPHAVRVAIPRGTATPQLDWPPLEVYWMSGDMYSTGIEEHEQDGITLIVLGGANTRMKDYYDLAELSSHLEFDGDVLLEAINRTLARRGRSVGELPLVGLSDAFGARTLNAQRWTTFVSRGQLDVEADLTATIGVIRRFVEPVLTAAVHADAFRLVWPPGGPWHE